MSTIRTKFIVVSLPRTGTKSLCQMAKDVGFEVSHAPGPAFGGFLGRADFIADTPAFQPSRIEKVLKQSAEVKFIMSLKPAEDWVASMQKTNLANNYNNMYEQYHTNRDTMSSHNIVDFESLYDVLKGPFDPKTATQRYKDHTTEVLGLIPNGRLLSYSFEDGWGPFANFLGVEVPDKELPHLNKNTMFDPLT